MSSSLRRKLIFGLCVATLSGLPAFGQAPIYSWKDASGKVHYGDRPPPGVDARRVSAGPREPDDAEAARRGLAERKFAEREKQAKTAETAKQSAVMAEQEKIRAENCQRARNTLAGLESGEIRFILNDKGERVALDGEQRTQEIARTRKAVDSWCQPAAAQ